MRGVSLVGRVQPRVYMHGGEEIQPYRSIDVNVDVDDVNWRVGVEALDGYD